MTYFEDGCDLPFVTSMIFGVDNVVKVIASELCIMLYVITFFPFVGTIIYVQLVGYKLALLILNSG